MPLIQKPNYNQIFASQAPDQDKPAVFNNYPEGWGVESRPNNGKPTIKGFNYLQQTSDLKDLWILQNGACLPYDESIEYAEGAVILKDGDLQQWKGGEWVRAANKGYNLDYFAEGKSYPLNAQIMLTNGDIVKSTIDGNTNDPNVNMMGWLNVGNTGEVESIVDLLLIANPKNGSCVFVKSRNTLNPTLNAPFSGGGEFVYDSSKASINDGGLIFNGWVRVWDGTSVHVDWFGADASGVTDSTDAVKAAIQAATGTLKSAPPQRETAAIVFGDGYYKVKDIPLVSGVTYKGQGGTSTFLVPMEGAEWVFKTTPEAVEIMPINVANRLTHCTISDLAIGYGYAPRIPSHITYSTTAGGIFQQASSWCKLKNIRLHGLGGSALKFIGVFDLDTDDVSIFSVGKTTLSPAIFIDRYPDSIDGSNCITFRRLHGEGVHQHFYFGRNSKLISFIDPKFEAQDVASILEDVQGINFINLFISNASVSGEYPFVRAINGDASYSPVDISFVNPRINRMDWFIDNQSRATVNISGGTAVRLGKLFTGSDLRLNNLYAFDCGPQFITCRSSQITRNTFKNILASTVTDGTEDFIVLEGADNTIESNRFLSYNTANTPFIKLDSNAVIRFNQFRGSVPYAIRGNESSQHYNNTAASGISLYTGTPTSQGYSALLNKKSSGLGLGNVSSGRIVVAAESTGTLVGVLGGGAFVTCRVAYDSKNYNLILAVDASASPQGVTVISKSLPIDVLSGVSSSVDGKLYINNWQTSTTGSDLTFTNNTGYSMTITAVVVNAVT